VVTSARYSRPLSLLESLTGTKTAQIGVPLDFNLGPGWFDGSLDGFVAPDVPSRKRVQEAGYEPDRIFAAGPPVLPNFGGEVDREAAREDLEFGDETHVLVRADSFDPTELDRIIFQGTLVERNVQFLFHHNGDGAVSQALRRSADQHGLSAAMFGRVPDLERYVAASDLVIASPADLTIPEIVSCRRPLLLVGAAEDYVHQVDTLLDAYGAEQLDDVLRLGSELEGLLDEETFGDLEERCAETRLSPGNRPVAEALTAALEAAAEWTLERPTRPAPEAPDGAEEPEASEGAEPTGPFEKIGTGASEDGVGDRRRLEGPTDDTDAATPRPSLSRAEAKDQLAELILNERELERRLSELEREQERWRNRLDLAREWGEEDLADEAKEILKEYIDDASGAKDELEDVRRQKEKLKRAAERGRGDGVSAQLEGDRGIGEDPERAAEIEERFEEMELDRDLEDLRDQVEGELGE
jgi:UDP-N-acetylglucosamine:LPS N-acetylglucosamine transferase